MKGLSDIVLQQKEISLAGLFCNVQLNSEVNLVSIFFSEK